MWHLYFDLFFGTGMNDICSPMVMILQDEGDAFWCFYHAMRKLVHIVVLSWHLCLFQGNERVRESIIDENFRIIQGKFFWEQVSWVWGVTSTSLFCKGKSSIHVHRFSATPLVGVCKRRRVLALPHSQTKTLKMEISYPAQNCASGRKIVMVLEFPKLQHVAMTSF